MRDHHLPVALQCPACGAKLDGALNTEGERGPRDGDPSICIECRALLVHSGTPVRALRYPTPQEQKEFLADAGVQCGIAALAELHRRNGKIR